MLIATKEKLKQILLQTNCFEDNIYLDFYCDLILTNRDTQGITYKTQRHHYIPVCYYKRVFHCKTRKESLKYANNDTNNFIVNLLFTDHILAHYYLYLCGKKHLQWNLFEGISYQLEYSSNEHIKRNINDKKGIIKSLNLFEGDVTKYQMLYEKCQIEKSTKNKRPVICIETQQIFESIRQASVSSGIDEAGIINCASGKWVTSGGYHWAYFEDKERIKVLQQYIGKPPESFAEICKRKSKTQKGTKFSSTHLESLRKTAEKLSDNVHCVEIDKTFPSVSAAMQYLRSINKTHSSTPCQINRACREGCRAYGYHWYKEKKGDIK